MIGILGVGTALMARLGGLILTISGGLRGEIRELAARVAALGRGVGGLEQRVARIEGLFEAIRAVLILSALTPPRAAPSGQTPS